MNNVDVRKCLRENNNRVNKSSPKSFGKNASLQPSRRRMHSPASCVSCIICNVTEPLQNVTEGAERYGAVRSVAGRYGTLREHYGAVTLRYGTISENVDFTQTAQNALICCMC